VLAHATPDALLADAVDAALVGLALGDEIVLVGSSTGGALNFLLASSSAQGLGVRQRIAAVVGISSAFRIRVPCSDFLGSFFSWCAHVLPSWLGGGHAGVVATLVIEALNGGKMRQLAARNALHPTASTLRYPAAAVLHCLAVIWEARMTNPAAVACPVLFVGSPEDGTISWGFTKEDRFPRLANASPKALHEVKRA